MAVVHFHQLLTKSSEKGLTGHQLGGFPLLTFFVYGVELQFAVPESVRNGYQNLAAKQWSGTEAIWLKKGPVLGGKWSQVHKSNGNGADDPDSSNVIRGKSIIAYYDSPGASTTRYFDRHPSQIYAVQNFTGWIEGEPISGGTAKHLCKVAAWYSAINIVDGNWGVSGKWPDWQFVSGTRANTGWENTDVPPPF